MVNCRTTALKGNCSGSRAMSQSVCLDFRWYKYKVVKERYCTSVCSCSSSSLINIHDGLSERTRQDNPKVTEPPDENEKCLVTERKAAADSNWWQNDKSLYVFYAMSWISWDLYLQLLRLCTVSAQAVQLRTLCPGWISTCPVLASQSAQTFFWGECCPVEIESVLDPCNPSQPIPSILAMKQYSLPAPYQMSPLTGTALCWPL